MKPIDGFFQIKLEETSWKLANPMKIPFTGLLEQTKSELIGAALAFPG